MQRRRSDKIFPVVSPRDSTSQGRYGRAACTYQHNRGGEEETRVTLKKKKRRKKKGGTIDNPGMALMLGSHYYWTTDAIVSRYPSQGVPWIVVSLLFSTRDVRRLLARISSSPLAPTSLLPASRPSIFHYGNASQVIPHFSYQDFDVNGACWISRRRSMMKSPRLITAFADRVSRNVKRRARAALKRKETRPKIDYARFSISLWIVERKRRMRIWFDKINK